MAKVSATPVTLENLGGGVLAEKFEVAMERVMKNIMDPNTKESVQREIGIKIKFKLSPDRDVVNVDIECTEKLAPDHGYGTMMFIDKGIKGELAAFEANPRQSELPFPNKKEAEADGEEATENNVRVIGGKNK